jgi:hypothetical protein
VQTRVTTCALTNTKELTLATRTLDTAVANKSMTPSITMANRERRLAACRAASEVGCAAHCRRECTCPHTASGEAQVRAQNSSSKSKIFSPHVRNTCSLSSSRFCAPSLSLLLCCLLSQRVDVAGHATAWVATPACKHQALLARTVVGRARVGSGNCKISRQISND